MHRTIIVGDIHGCLHEFETLLKKVHFNERLDRLILLGDMINKGPDSLGVLELTISLKADVVIGNHELNFYRYCRSNKNNISSFELLKSQFGKRLEFFLSWMEELPVFIEEDDFLAVHGGLIPDRRPDPRDLDIMTSIRTWDGVGIDLNNSDHSPWFSSYKKKKLVIFGHWAALGLIQKENVIGLDSGCVYGRKLSAVILPERKIVQVEARKDYASLG